MEQRFTFNGVADLYSAARPGYPDALFDDIVALAGLRAGDAMLEIGCGPGQATRSFARRGLRITALEPGGELIRVARQNLADFEPIEFFETTFEAWPVPEAAFKLVAAAQSWHWVAPEARFAKAAAALAPGGFLAVFGNASLGLPSPIREDVQRAYVSHDAADLKGPSADGWYLPSGPIPKLFEESGLFAPPIHKVYPWSRPHSASSYVELLRTNSHHLLLAPAHREALLAAVAEAIAGHGETFELSRT